MGFKWSLYLFQYAVTKLVETAAGASPSRRLQTFGGSRRITADGLPLRYVYVGNIGAMGSKPAGMQTFQEQAGEALDQVGLTTHEHVDAQQGTEVLGVSIGGRTVFRGEAGRPVHEGPWIRLVAAGFPRPQPGGSRE